MHDFGNILLGILIPFAGTSLGAGCVYFLKNGIQKKTEKGLLAFAAGAMMYVVVEELIPETAEGSHSNIGTIGFAFGFSLMMMLDVALG